jgi:hypothetical protein
MRDLGFNERGERLRRSAQDEEEEIDGALDEQME